MFDTDAKRLKRQQDKIQEAVLNRQASAKAERLKKFLASEVWTKDLEPMLAKDQDDSNVQTRWSPQAANRQTLDLAALSSAYYSGAGDQIVKFLSDIRIEIAKGDEAQKVLEDQEKDK